ncbi:MAG: hypothetical protein NVS2B7_04480 [Herpetosiphon sp.]
MNRSLSRWKPARIFLMITLVSMFAIVSGPIETVLASHGRALQLAWVKSGTNVATFTLTGSFRRSFFTPQPNVGDTISEGTLTFGDGASEPATTTVVSVDTANDVVTSRSTHVHTYPSAGPFTADIDGCCRLGSAGGHINNTDGRFRVETIVDFGATSGSPSGSVAPIVDCPLNGNCTFTIGATAPAGQTLRFRFATSAEAAGSTSTFVQPGPPNAPNAATIDAATGVYTWNTAGATLAPAPKTTYYSTQVIIESLLGGKVVSRSGVDFFLRLGAGGTTNLPPVFGRCTPAAGTIFNMGVGTTLVFKVDASDPEAGDTVTLAVIGLPTGATFTTTPANPTSGTFTFVPTAAGTILLTLTAQDQTGLGAVPRQVTINVTTGGPTIAASTCVPASADKPEAAKPAFVTVVQRPTPNLATTRSPSDYGLSRRFRTQAADRPTGVVTYEIETVNRGQGDANDVIITMPFDGGVVRVLDAKFSRTGAWVSSVTANTLEIRTGPIAKNGDIVTTTVRLLTRPKTPDFTLLGRRLSYVWSDAVSSPSGVSNMTMLTVAGKENNQPLYPGVVSPMSGPAGISPTFSSGLFKPDERVSFWYHGPDGKDIALATTIADVNGNAGVVIDTSGTTPGTYLLVAYGDWTRFTVVASYVVR